MDEGLKIKKWREKMEETDKSSRRSSKKPNYVKTKREENTKDGCCEAKKDEVQI